VAEGGTVSVLVRPLNSSWSRSIAFVVLALRHWLGAREGEEAVATFLQAVGDVVVFEPPFADEGLPARLDLVTRRRVDHIGVVGGDLLVQARPNRSSLCGDN
jgi:hypothetical protein